MAKRKPQPEIADESTPSERVHKAGGQAEIISDERWHILYTPQWRTQIDLGEATGTIEQVKSIAESGVTSVVIEAFDNEYIQPHKLGWNKVNDDSWIANGHDGLVWTETTLPIVTITRVIE